MQINTLAMQQFPVSRFMVTTMGPTAISIHVRYETLSLSQQ